MAERIDVIRAGFYRVRLIRGGLHVGCRFWRDGEQWFVEIDGRTHRTIRVDGQPDRVEPLDPYDVWPWACGQQITEREFDFLARRREWAKEHRPDHPAANPYQPPDLSKMPPRF